MCTYAWFVTAVARLLHIAVCCQAMLFSLRTLGELQGRDVDQSRHFCVCAGFVVVLQDPCFLR